MTMFRSILVILTLVLATFASPSRADKPDFMPPSLSTFDGVRWAQMEFGKTTGQDVKNLYKIDKRGNTVPWSLRISTPKGSGSMVNVLFVGRDDKKDAMAGVLIRYEGGLPLDQLNRDLGENGKSYYAAGRNDEWFMYCFADKGIVAFAVNRQGVYIANAVLLLPPATVKDGCLDLGLDPTEIEPIVDIHAREPRIMLFGTVDVTTSLSGLTMTDSEESRLKDDLRLATAAGTMLYQSYAPGSYKVNVDGNYSRDKGGSITVTCTIAGICPYGPVHASGEDTETISKNTDVSNSGYYTNALYKARDNAEHAFMRAMRAMGPPTPDDTRRAAWNRAFNGLRQNSLTTQSLTVAVPPAVVF